ncbi:uncharacterized protein LOC143536575 [Bidens hawaiensis]|uniref:uncharacterized protein LOC143536575 n=1 Tax=Bidens hawaiensis TaxID=980011 RepID=UPI0040490AF7
MLCDSKLPLFFWAEAINTACYVPNRVLINKSQMKTPYEIVYGHKPTVAHFRAFGCPCTLLNLDSTPKFGIKADDCYFMGYVGHTAYRVYNKSTKQIVESYDIRWLEENETDARVGPDRLFDYNEQFKPFNVPSAVDPETSDIVGCADEDEELFDILQKGPVAGVDPPELFDNSQPSSSGSQDPDLTLVSESTPSSPVESGLPSTSTPSANVPSVEGESLIRQVFGSTLFPDAIPNEYIASTLYQHSTTASGWRNPLIDSLDELTNFSATSSVPDHSVASRIPRDHPIENIIGPFESGVSTRSQTGNINNCLYSCFISQIEPISVDMTLQEPSWVGAMHEKLNQFDKLNVWKLVELPSGKKSLDTRWVFSNKQDDTGVIVINKARLVVRGFRQVEGLDYTEVYAPVARLEAIRIFLAYASYMGFTVYQMNVKTAFLYGEVKEEIYVDQPPGFRSSKYPDHTLFLKTVGKDLILVQIYVDDNIFGSTSTTLCTEFEGVMKKRFEMSSLGEMTIVLGLQVRQSATGILLHQGKYIENILAKFEFQDSKSAATSMAERPLLSSDAEGKSVDQTYYRSMIGSLMYLTASRPDIMFAVHTDNNMADLFTKPVGTARFNVLVGFLKMLRFDD